MAMVNIDSGADIIALGMRDDHLLQINLRRLEELSTAIESYNLLRQIVYPRKWSCKKITVLEELCTLSTDLWIIRDRLLPIVDQAQPNPNLELDDDVAQAVVTMGVKAQAMESAGKQFIKGLTITSLICERIVGLGEPMATITQDLLAKSETLETFQDGIPDLIDRINEVLDTEMQF